MLPLQSVNIGVCTAALCKRKSFTIDARFLYVLEAGVAFPENNRFNCRIESLCSDCGWLSPLLCK